MKKLLFFLIIFAPFYSIAQTGTIKGIVKDEAGTPVVSGIVRVKGTTLTTLTDSTEAYELSNVPNGHYVIEIGDDKNTAASENVEVKDAEVILNMIARF